MHFLSSLAFESSLSIHHTPERDNGPFSVYQLQKDKYFADITSFFVYFSKLHNFKNIDFNVPVKGSEVVILLGNPFLCEHYLNPGMFLLVVSISLTLKSNLLNPESCTVIHKSSTLLKVRLKCHYTVN